MDQPLLHTIVQSIPSGILAFHPEGEITFANDFAERLLDFQPGQWRGFAIRDIFLEEDRAIFLPNIIKLTRTHGRFTGEILLRSHRDRHFFARLTTKLYQQKDTEPILATIEDISRLKAFERQSRESDRLLCLGKMVDRMAHLIRNPIASVGGFASRLLKSNLTEEHRRLYQEIIYQECNRLDFLLRSLAGFTALPLPVLVEGSVDQVLTGAIDLIPEDLQARASAWHTPASEELRPLRTLWT